MWNCFRPKSSGRHLTFGTSCGRLGHNTAQKSLSFNWLFCFRWRASCQQKQILLILTKLQNMKGNGQSRFFWRAHSVVCSKTCVSQPHNILPLLLCTSTNTQQISISPPPGKTAAIFIIRSLWNFTLIFHNTYFNMHCSFFLFPLPSRTWNPSTLGCQHQKMQPIIFKRWQLQFSLNNLLP